jgi:hypothetical protein
MIFAYAYKLKLVVKIVVMHAIHVRVKDIAVCLCHDPTQLSLEGLRDMASSAILIKPGRPTTSDVISQVRILQTVIWASVKWIS